MNPKDLPVPFQRSLPVAIDELRFNHHFKTFINYVRFLREEAVVYSGGTAAISSHAELARTIGVISAHDEILRLVGEQPLDKLIQAGESAPTEGLDRSDSNP